MSKSPSSRVADAAIGKPAPIEVWPVADIAANRTGGWLWHFRAWSAGRRWDTARDAIERWLAETVFDAKRLVLIGASAGWMMPVEFLERFEAVEAIDIDPLAPALFRLRHGGRLKARGVKLTWHNFDALRELAQALERWPDAALFFDNVLGQQIYRYSDLDLVEKALSSLSGRLAGREWASIHDWLSGPALPGADRKALIASGLVATVGQHNHYQLGGRVLKSDACAQWMVEQLGGQGSWQDHRVAGIFPEGARLTCIPWEFRPGKWHWLQAARVPPHRAG